MVQFQPARQALLCQERGSEDQQFIFFSWSKIHATLKA
jgi:hypothetical protein